MANAVKYLNSGVTEALGFHFVSLIQLAHVELSNLRHLFCLSFYFKTLRYKKKHGISEGHTNVTNWSIRLMEEILHQLIW